MMTTQAARGDEGGGHAVRIVPLTLAVFLMMPDFSPIVTQAECRDHFVVHGLAPLGDDIAVSPLIWRQKLMDARRGHLG
jgi:hypothetical protein